WVGGAGEGGALVAQGLLSRAHAGGADRMIGGGAAAADETEQPVVVVALRARLDLLGDVARNGGRLKDTAHRGDSRRDGVAVLLGREIVRVDRRRLPRIGGFDAPIAAALRPPHHASGAERREKGAAPARPWA